jgi:UDP-GlcNAc:undecaprenyl-phosphate GlcNAc-1-phosphate transferase
VAAIVATRFPAPIGPVLVVVMVVTLINAVNMLDGLDGLVAGLLLPAMGGAAILFTGSERDVALAAMGALGGFLLFNRPPAKIYLGDGGSYLLGTLLGLMLASAWAPGSRWSLGVAALVLLALPVAEIVVVVVRRLRAGQPIFEGDRSHSYDRLSDRGWSVRRIDIAAVAAQLVLVASGLLVATR